MTVTYWTSPPWFQAMVMVIAQPWRGRGRPGMNLSTWATGQRLVVAQTPAWKLEK